MKIHRFIGNFDLSQPVIEITDPELVHQMREVLGLQTGERVMLGDGRGTEAAVSIRHFSKGGVSVSVEDVIKNENEPAIHLTLYCAILKRENFELVVQKATELGVAEIVPLITARTVKLEVRHDRLEKIIHEAAEQSGRGIVPMLHPAMKFEDAVHDSTAKNDATYFFDMNAPLFERHQTSEKPNRIGIFIGPEGGWSEQEILSARGKGLTICSLEKTTLRAETAAIVGVFRALDR